MRLFGIEFKRAGTSVVKAEAAVPMEPTRGWFNIIHEVFGGAWQSNLVLDSPKDLLAFSAVYASVAIISNDIAKLCVELMEEGMDGIGVEVSDNDPRAQVLLKPNHFQNRKQFFENWVVSKLLAGNTCVLKQRNAKRIVEAMYVLNAQVCTPLITETGDVYYRLGRDDLSGIKDPIIVPASEIIHDRMNCLWHPLVGVSPLYACALTASMGRSIQKDSNKFFVNMSRPSGALTSPGTIDDITANRIKDEWEKNFSGGNLGRLAVLGDGLKYEAMTIPAQEAQLIEQLKWTVEDVARCFNIPAYKLGGTTPPQGTISSLNQGYYSDCLQSLIESLELCLDTGLELPTGTYTEFELEDLLRMDAAARYEAKNKAVGGGWMAPDEARKGENLRPVAGGATPYLQQQNYSLGALAKRDSREDPFADGNSASKNDASAFNEVLTRVIRALETQNANS